MALCDCILNACLFLKRLASVTVHCIALQHSTCVGDMGCCTRTIKMDRGKGKGKKKGLSVGKREDKTEPSLSITIAFQGLD